MLDLPPDFGDAPDTGPGTAAGNYHTLVTDNGPRHNIDFRLLLGHPSTAIPARCRTQRPLPMT